MKNIILFLLFLVSIFVINIAFYYTSSDYRDFIKRVKTESENTKEVPDFSVRWENNYFSWKIEKNKEENKTEKTDSDKKQQTKNTKKPAPVTTQEVKLWKWYQDILNMFSEYDLKKLEVNANLFDLTNEYPDAYYEFYSPKLTLYFFTTKNYKEVYDIFDVLQLELPFKINAMNNFWEKSFYINFNKDVNDAVRMVILHKWIVFWLKVDKNEYSKIKQRLQNLRNK